MNKKRWMAYAAAVMALSLTASMTAMASEEETHKHAFSIDMTDENDEAWQRIAMTNDDMVKTGLNIRDIPSSDGYVIACLYRGGAVEVVHKDEHWTEVEVGDVTGFIKNEYLTYGTEAKGLAEHYGVYGLEASWNDVYVFEAPDAAAEIIHTAMAGETFELLEDQGHWQKVKFGEEDDVAYVSIEDVFEVILVDDLIIVDEPYKTSEDTYEDDGYEEDTYEDSSSDSSSGSSSSSNDNWTGSTSTGSSSTGSANNGSTSTGSNSGTASTPSTPSTEAPSTEPPSTEAPAEDDGTVEDEYIADDDYSEDDAYDDTYYEDDSTVDADDTSDEVYEDIEDVEEVEDAEEYVEENAAAPEETYTEETYTEEIYAEDTSYEDDYVEEYVEETEAAEDTSSSYSASDLDLMAAIIYCEAGNQSYEGQVAVGAVVMNRVNSSSFPDTISEVIYQSGQFTPASSGTLDSALANGVPSTCYDAAAAAMAGENPVGDALYFNGGSGSGMQIGDHQFY